MDVISSAKSSEGHKGASISSVENGSCKPKMDFVFENYFTKFE